MHPPERDNNQQSRLHILSRYKWIIIGCIVAGIVSGIAIAGIAYSLRKPIYQSDAKLMVRYVVDRSGIDSVDSKRGAAAPSSGDETIINSEIEILTSWDLATEVAEAVSAENPAVPGASKGQAAELAAQIHGNLDVVARKGSNVIAISYRDGNPA